MLKWWRHPYNSDLDHSTVHHATNCQTNIWNPSSVRALTFSFGTDWQTHRRPDKGPDGLTHETMTVPIGADVGRIWLCMGVRYYLLTVSSQSGWCPIIELAGLYTRHFSIFEYIKSKHFYVKSIRFSQIPDSFLPEASVGLQVLSLPACVHICVCMCVFVCPSIMSLSAW